jgi:hypothetical protein
MYISLLYTWHFTEISPKRSSSPMSILFVDVGTSRFMLWSKFLGYVREGGRLNEQTNACVLGFLFIFYCSLFGSRLIKHIGDFEILFTLSLMTFYICEVFPACEEDILRVPWEKVYDGSLFFQLALTNVNYECDSQETETFCTFLFPLFSFCVPCCLSETNFVIQHSKQTPPQL